MGFCKSCGFQLNGDEKFCRGCGTPVATQPSQSAQPNQSAQWNQGAQQYCGTPQWNSGTQYQGAQGYGGNSSMGGSQRVYAEPSREFLAEYKAFWHNYTNFSDRTNKRGYWMTWLTSLIIGCMIGVAGLVIPFISWIYGLAMFVPQIAITIRRLHDTGKNPAWALTYFVPFIGWIWLIVLMCGDSIPPDERNLV